MHIHNALRATLFSVITSSTFASGETKAILVHESCEIVREFQLSARRLPDEVDPKSDPVEVRLLVRISKDGRVLGSSVTSSNVGRPLVRSMQSAIRACTFTPAKNGDVAVDGVADVSLRLYKDSFVAAGVARCPFPTTPSGVRLPSDSVFTRLRVFVGSDTKPTRTEILQSSGVPSLDEAAQAAMMQCKPLPEAERTGVIGQFMDIAYEWRWRLTPRWTSGPATAGCLGPVWGTRYIFPAQAKPSHRTGPVSSNVRRQIPSSLQLLR